MSVASPNRERWDGWVTFAWLLAVLACIGGVAIIALAGFVEVPRENSFGRVETVREANVFIWSLGIGQAISATMLAALFSMVNSIYKNSCLAIEGKSTSHADSEAPSLTPASAEKRQVVNRESGPRIVKIADNSPLFDKAYVDWCLTEINDGYVATSKDIKPLLKPGENQFLFTKPDGELQTIVANVKPDLRLFMTLSR